jgi:hypothetical protein
LEEAERVARAGGYRRMHLTIDPGNNDDLAFLPRPRLATSSPPR